MAAPHSPVSAISEFDRFKNVTKFAADRTGHSNFISKSSSLHQQGQDFESSGFMAKAAYVQLSDPGISGPEYNIDRQVYLQSRPRSAEARRAWEDLYDMYRMRRMDICGLDLEPMPLDSDRKSVQEVLH